ncbi:TolC family protein [Gaopeijia maritima]|uniref:TolC family protein n=1 Tax=Gaopeijia maritima TaxID=3119007 RepID=UPI00326BD9B4
MIRSLPTLTASVVCAVTLLTGGPAAAQETVPQTPPSATSLTLDEAVARATGDSEEVQLARSQVSLADAQVTAARSQALPQISGTLGYTRTFESSFGGDGGFSFPDSLRFSPDSTAALPDRVRYLETNGPNAAFEALGGLFSDLPFGQEHVYQGTITASQLLYAGGRVGSALDIARRYRSAARLQLAEESAEIEFQVRQAYYQALLARELASGAAEALAQADDFLAEERLRLEAGTASDLDVLRAEVSRDNLRPQLVQADNAADLALLNLKRLVDLPLTAPVELATPLAPPTAGEAARGRIDAGELSQTRAAVAAAREQVEIRNSAVGVARSSFLPEVRASMSYGRQLLPSGIFEFDGSWRTDWTAGVTVSVPIFNGGQRFADLQVAQAELDQARIQLAQLEEVVQLEYEQALAERERALEAIAARETTVEAAQRVHDLTVLQYEQGQATQLEVSQARLELLDARTNLAQAIADFHVADAELDRALVAAGETR